jgi:hypothetical protein
VEREGRLNRPLIDRCGRNKPAAVLGECRLSLRPASRIWVFTLLNLAAGSPDQLVWGPACRRRAVEAVFAIAECAAHWAD